MAFPLIWKKVTQYPFSGLPKHCIDGSVLKAKELKFDTPIFPFHRFSYIKIILR